MFSDQDSSLKQARRATRMPPSSSSIFWREAASARVKPWPTDAAQDVVNTDDPEPHSGSLVLQATPLQAPFLDPNRFQI